MLRRELTLLVWRVRAGCLDVPAELLDSEEFYPTGIQPRSMFFLPSISSLQPRDFASVCQFLKKRFPVYTVSVTKKRKGNRPLEQSPPSPQPEEELLSLCPL